MLKAKASRVTTAKGTKKNSGGAACNNSRNFAEVIKVGPITSCYKFPSQLANVIIAEQDVARLVCRMTTADASSVQSDLSLRLNFQWILCLLPRSFRLWHSLTPFCRVLILSVSSGHKAEFVARHAGIRCTPDLFGNDTPTDNPQDNKQPRHATPHHHSPQTTTTPHKPTPQTHTHTDRHFTHPFQLWLCS